MTLSGTLDSEVAHGIIAGLKGNKTLRRLQLDTSNSNLKFIAAILSKEECSVTLLFIKDLFVLQRYESLCLSEWKVKVLDESSWCSFLNVLKKVASEVKLVVVLDSLDHRGCIM